MTVDAYLRRVGSSLAPFGPLAMRPLAEIREHLRESTQTLMETGATREDAEAEAIERFGDAKEIAEELATVLKEESDMLERVVKIMAIMNMFTAVWGLAATAMLNPTGELLAATSIISVVTVAAALVCTRRELDPGSLLVAGVALIAVGSAGIFWALIGAGETAGAHPGLAALMAVYCLHGVLAVWAGSRRSRAEAAATS